MSIDEKKPVKPTSPVNKDILLFFLKLILLVIIWEYSYYHILKPVRIPDRALTNIITSAVTTCFNIFSGGAKFTWQECPGMAAARVLRDGNPVLYIVDICNGLSLIVIYIGFIILLPSPIKRKIVFCVIGTLVLIMANVIRCSLLYWIYRKRADLFDFSHHYVFSILMYLLIFFGWYLFTKKNQQHEVL